MERDREFLYVLIELKIGILERFNRQRDGQELTSGAVGFLNIGAGGTEYQVFLPVFVGYGVGSATDQPSTAVGVGYQLSRKRKGEGEFTTIVEKRYPDDKEWIATEGRYVELKIPLNELGAGRNTEWDVGLDAF